MTDPTTGSMLPTSHSINDVDLLKIGEQLLGRYKIIVKFVALILSLSTVYLLVATRIYKADALLQIEASQGGRSLLFELMSPLADGDGGALKEIEIIKSRMILGRAVERMHLDVVVQPKFFPIVGKIWQVLFTRHQPSLEVDQFSAPNYLLSKKFQLVVKDAKLGTYQLYSPNGDLLVEGRSGQTYQHNNIAINIASLRARSGQRFMITKLPLIYAVEQLRNRLSAKEITKQTGILKLSLTGMDTNEIEKTLNEIMRSYVSQNISRSTEEISSSVIFLKKHLPEIKRELVETENKLNLYRKNHESIDLPMEAKSALENIIHIDTRLSNIEYKEKTLAKRFTKSHPQYLTLLERRQMLVSDKQKIEQSIRQMPRTQQDILSLQRDVEVNQKIYISLLSKLQELNVAKASATGNVRIIDQALVGTRLVAPKKKLIIVLALLMGVIIGGAYVIITDYLFAGVTNLDDIESLGLSILATIPVASTCLGQDDDCLVALHHPTELVAEALRSLRTNIHFSARKSGNRIIAITGPSLTVGKSFISSNLAIIMSKNNERVLLIDADMRRGHLHRYFNLPGTQGLSTLLVEHVDPKSCVVSTSVPGLDFLAKGVTPSEPSEILMHQQFADFLEWAKNNYDWVIVDTPPVLAVTDAVIISKLSHITILVAKFGLSRLKEIALSNNRLEKGGVKVHGLILNSVENSKLSQDQYHYAYSSDS